MVALVGLTAGHALAAHVGCGQVITQDTILDSDLEGCGEGDGIVIGADRITLDLNGHTIDAGQGNGVVNEGFDGIPIRGGEIRNFRTGIRLLEVLDSRVEQTSLSGNQAGIVLSGHVVSGNALRTVGLAIDLFGAGQFVTERNRVDNNLVSDALHGLGVIASEANWIRGNSIESSDWGILFQGSSHNLLKGNRVSGEEAGIIAGTSGHILIRTNMVSSGRGHGIFVYQSPSVAIGRNRLLQNGGHGIFLSDSKDSRITRNVASNNGGDGVHVDSRSSGAAVVRNLAEGNGDDGLEIAAPASLLRRNTASYNGDFGIEAVPGVAAKHNLAFGNNNPMQCLNVLCDMK